MALFKNTASNSNTDPCGKVIYFVFCMLLTPIKLLEMTKVCIARFVMDKRHNPRPKQKFISLHQQVYRGFKQRFFTLNTAF